MNAAINRAVSVENDGENFEMLLTTKAAADIDREFGGLDKVGEALDGDDRDASVETASKLIAILCNAGSERYNYRHRDTPRRMIGHGEVGILTTPGEMTSLLRSAIEAVRRGKETYIESEQAPGDGKN